MWKPGTVGPGNEEPVDREAYGSSYIQPLQSLNRKNLPVARFRDELLYSIEKFPVTVVVGDTGSGKSTQLVQYLYEANWTSRDQMVVCTQPRRLAAVSVATRVASEMNSRLGGKVGYSVRFDHCVNEGETRIKFCTDGMLLRDTLSDPLLSKYSVIMLDEAHERSLHTDLLLGLVKKIMRQRPELRVVVSSATLQVDAFKSFFDRDVMELLPVTTDVNHLEEAVVEKKVQEKKMKCNVVHVHGRQFPVDILYLNQPAPNCLRETISTVLKIHDREPPGDILVFLPGQDEIQHVVREIRDQSAHLGKSIFAVPLYAALPRKLQRRAVLPSPGQARKVIVSTTIAETSITLEGIAYVVDSCLVKLPFFNPITGIESLMVTLESQAAATQRAGRAGRVRPGKCFRLCTEEHFKKLLPKETIPEIQRVNLTWILVQLRALGIQDILRFEFISAPSAESMIRAFEMLHALGIVDDDGKLIEPLGTHMAEFPVDPKLAKMMLSSFQYRCTEEVLTIAAAVSVQNIFLSQSQGTKEQRAVILESIGEFANKRGDLLTYLKVYDEFTASVNRRNWCNENSVDYRALQRVDEVRKQLQRYVKRFEATISEDDDVYAYDHEDSILHCIVSGLFANAARLDGDGKYKTIKDNIVVQIHPTSIYYHLGNCPNWIVFNELVLTSSTEPPFIRDISEINPTWLTKVAPKFYGTKDTSTELSGSSGAIGLPKNKFKKPAPKKAKVEEPAKPIGNRIVFKKPSSSKSNSKLPVHIGKSKGGLRSQF